MSRRARARCTPPKCTEYDFSWLLAAELLRAHLDARKAGKGLDATLSRIGASTRPPDFRTRSSYLASDEDSVSDAMMEQHAAAKFEGTASKGSAPVNALSGAKMMEMMDKDGNGKASPPELMKFLHELKAKNAEMHGVEPPKIKDAVPDSSGEFASFGNYKRKIPGEEAEAEPGAKARRRRRRPGRARAGRVLWR